MKFGISEGMVLAAIILAMRNKALGFVMRVLLSVAGLLITVLVLEVLLSAASGIFWKRLSTSDRRLGWKYVHTPETIKRYYTSEGWADIYINTDGFRSAEFISDEDSYRVMILGDSMTFGNEVSQEKIFTSLLERKIEETYPDRKINVMNYGVAGFGTGQELICLKEYGDRYPPDVVVLMLFVNDFDDNTLTVYTNRYVPHFKLEDDKLVLYNKPGRLQRIRTFLRDKSVLFYFLFHRLEVFDRILKEKERYRAEETEKMLLMQRLLDAIRAYTSERNIPLFLFYIGRETGRERRSDWVRKYCEENSVSFGLVPQKKGELISDNIHWNMRGHAATAEIVYGKLAESKVLDTH